MSAESDSKFGCIAEAVAALLDESGDLTIRMRALNHISAQPDPSGHEALRKIIRGEWTKENDRMYLLFRKFVAGSCAWSLPRQTKTGGTFLNYPGIPLKVTGGNRQGLLGGGYGPADCNFHYEYPIEGFGTRKDLILVTGREVPSVSIFDWCRQHDIIVACSLCGGDITFQVKSLEENPCRGKHLWTSNSTEA